MAKIYKFVEDNLTCFTITLLCFFTYSLIFQWNDFKMMVKVTFGLDFILVLVCINSYMARYLQHF